MSKRRQKSPPFLRGDDTTIHGSPNDGTEIRDAQGRVIGHTAGVRPDPSAGRHYGDVPQSDAKRTFGL